MRIIAGEFRRRNLFSPPGLTTRPIPDRVKESLFSMLGTRIDNAHVLDAFAGSGAIGLEALSRGAADCVFVEKDRVSADVLEKNIAMFNCQDRATVIRGDALGLSVVPRCPQPLDLAFFDPPYPLVQNPTGWRRVLDQCAAVINILADDGFLILRTPYPHLLAEEVPGETELPPALLPRRFKKHKKKPRDRHFEDFEPEPPGLEAESKAADKDMADDELGDPIAPSLPAADGSTPAPVPAEYHIPGARGPETHKYGTMTVHFYMKKKSS